MELAGLLRHPIRPFQTRVFCVGWSKTGTTSLTEALCILGLFSWHFAPWTIGYEKYWSEASISEINFDAIAEYTAVSDLPICALCRELDEAFPGSLFILTTRDIEAWTASAIAQVKDQLELYGCMSSVERWAYGTDAIDENAFRARYIRHQNQVLEYFSGRSDLLVIDVTQGNPWHELCAFLQLPVPAVPFPHLNRRVIQ